MDVQRLAVGAVLTVAMAAGSPSPAVAKRGPELRVFPPPATAVAGSAFTVRARITGAAPRSRVVFLLSRDARRSRGDRTLGKPVKPRRTKRGTIAARRVRVPATAAGTYRLIACVTASRRPSRCAAARRALRVTRPAAPAPAPSPATVPAGGGGGSPAPGGGGDGGGGDPAPEPTVFDLPADPLSAGVTLASQSATRTIDSDAESVPLTGPDGTRYELAFPDGALMSSQRITLRAVESFDRLPFAGAPLGAVVAEPAGLRLLRAATLRVIPARTVPASAQAGFGFQPDGGELHLRPLGLDAAVIEMPVTILGGYGVAEATTEEPATMADRLPTRFEDRLAHVLSPLAAQMRVPPPRSLGRPARAAEAADPVVDEAVLLLMIAFDEVSALIDEALADDTKLDEAISRFAAWYANAAAVDLTGAVQLEIDSANRRLRLALIDAYRAAGARCAAGAAKLSNLAVVMKSELRLRAFGFAFDSADVARERDRCLGMEVGATFVTSAGHTASYDCGDGTSSSASASASGLLRIPPFELDPAGDARIEGSGPSRVVTETMSSSFTPCTGAQTSCNESVTDADRPAWTATLELGLDPGDPGAAPATFRLELDGLLTSPGPCSGFGATGRALADCWFLEAACRQAVGLQHFGFSHNSGRPYYRVTLALDGTLSPQATRVVLERSGTVNVQTANETTTADVEVEAILE